MGSTYCILWLDGQNSQQHVLLHSDHALHSAALRSWKAQRLSRILSRTRSDENCDNLFRPRQTYEANFASSERL